MGIHRTRKDEGDRSIDRGYHLFQVPRGEKERQYQHQSRLRAAEKRGRRSITEVIINLQIDQTDSPHIFIGASSSSSIGWLMKISRAFVQRCLISYSASWTGFPGRLPRTAQTPRERQPSVTIPLRYFGAKEAWRTVEVQRGPSAGTT